MQPRSGRDRRTLPVRETSEILKTRTLSRRPSIYARPSTSWPCQYLATSPWRASCFDVTAASSQSAARMIALVSGGQNAREMRGAADASLRPISSRRRSTPRPPRLSRDLAGPLSRRFVDSSLATVTERCSSSASSEPSEGSAHATWPSTSGRPTRSSTSAGKGIVLSEPSVVAIDHRTGEVHAVGAEAKRMLGRTPGNDHRHPPAQGRRHRRLRRHRADAAPLHPKVTQNRWAHPRVVICVPSGVTGVEKTRRRRKPPTRPAPGGPT